MPSKFLHYDISKKIGEGGMGIVYLAKDTRLNRDVALKFLPKHIAKDTSKHDRFRVEARAAAGLNHRNIAQVYAIEEAKGELCIVLEFVEGYELKDLIDNQSLGRAEKIKIAEDIATGIQAAHQKGIIHRDIKSRNIMVDSSENVKIMDFGLARFEGSDQPESSETTAGTTAYMSPEQLRGEEGDARSDIWSYGVVLYELFTGKLPFQGMHEAAIMYSITEEEPLPMDPESSEIPEYIRQIINRCLEKKPEDRYQELDEVLEDIREGKEAIIGGKNDEEAYSTQKYLTRWLVAAVAVLLLTVVIFWWQSDAFLFGQIPQKKYLAVLPIENVGENPELEALSAGLTETFSYRLSNLEQYEDQYWVTPASEIRNSNVKSAALAHELFGINLAISSTIQTIQDSTRLIISLIDAENRVSINSAMITVHSDNLLQLEKKGVQAMLEMLRIEVRPVMVEKLSLGDTDDSGAYEQYLKGISNLTEQANLDMLNAAIEHFKNALEADPEYPLALAGLGEAYWRKYVMTRNIEFIDRAKESLDKALSIEPKIPHVQFLMGLLEDGVGNHEEAIQYFESALKLDPKYIKASRVLASVYGEIGETEKAIDIFNDIIENRPESIIGYNGLGIFFLDQSNWDQAIQNFEKVIELTPSNAQVYSNLGYAYYYKGKIEQARQMFVRSLAIDNSPNTANNLASLYYYQGMYSEAADMYEIILEDDEYKSRYEYWGGYAAVVEMSEGIEEATELYERAIEQAQNELQVNPNDMNVLTNIAVYHSRLKHREEALDLINQVLTLDQESSAILLNIVRVYENLGMRDEAMKWIREEHISEIESLPEFEPLSQDPAFIDLKEKYQSNTGNE